MCKNEATKYDKELFNIKFCGKECQIKFYNYFKEEN